MKFGEQPSYEVGDYVVTRRFGIGRVLGMPNTPEGYYSLLLTTGATGSATALNLKPATSAGVSHFERAVQEANAKMAHHAAEAISLDPEEKQ